MQRSAATHERHGALPPAGRETPRERLTRQRAEAALARTPGWLGAGRRWQAFADTGCPCCSPAQGTVR